MSNNNDAKDAIKTLRDFFNFKAYITTGCAKTFWNLQVLLALAWIIWGESLLFSPGSRILISLFWLVISRLFMEAFVILFRIAELLREIRDLRMDSKV